MATNIARIAGVRHTTRMPVLASSTMDGVAAGLARIV
jgi:hypothetical protein